MVKDAMRSSIHPDTFIVRFTEAELVTITALVVRMIDRVVPYDPNDPTAMNLLNIWEKLAPLTGVPEKVMVEVRQKVAAWRAELAAKPEGG